MVTTTTPNPDDTPPETGTVERQLYPTPGDPVRLILNADELPALAYRHAGQLFVVHTEHSDWGDEPHIERAYIEFADGTRYAVMHA